MNTDDTDTKESTVAQCKLYTNTWLPCKSNQVDLTQNKYTGNCYPKGK